MRDHDIDMRIRDILQRSYPSNDNMLSMKTKYSSDQGDVNPCNINIVGDHNVVIEANILFTAFVFIVSCIWLSLLR